MIRFMYTIMHRDIYLAYSKMAIVIGVLGFFMIASNLFLFAIPDIAMLPVVAPAIIWVCALLASMLALEGIYRDDFKNGVLEQLWLQGKGRLPVVIAKVIAHWCITGLPLVLFSPLLQLLLGGTATEYKALCLGTITLSLLTSLGGALTLESQRPNLVMGLLILPLYIPMMIFGVQHDYTLLFGMILFMVPICIGSSVYALNLAMDI